MFNQFLKIILLTFLLCPHVVQSDEIRGFFQVDCYPELKIFEMRGFLIPNISDTELFERNDEGRSTGKLNQLVVDKLNLIDVKTKHIECILQGKRIEPSENKYELKWTYHGYQLLENGEVKIRDILFEYGVNTLGASTLVHSMRIIGESIYGGSHIQFEYFDKSKDRSAIYKTTMSFNSTRLTLPMTFEELIKVNN